MTGRGGAWWSSAVGWSATAFASGSPQYDEAREHEIVVFCEEPLPAYDRVQLTSYLGGRSAEQLLLAEPSWYAERQIKLLIGQRAVAIDRTERAVIASSGESFPYDVVVLATGSRPFVPRLGVATNPASSSTARSRTSTESRRRRRARVRRR